jgi:hypothetical protein
MFKKLFLICCLASAGFVLQAQENFQVGLMAGVTNYQGDLSPGNGAFNWESVGNFHGSAGIFLRLLHNDFLNMRLQLQYGKVSGTDADAPESRRFRNLSFQSNIWEVALIEEWNIFGLNADRGKIVTPYLAGGIALFRFNPKTDYLGQLIELQPLGTEGQGIPGFDPPYALVQLAIPMGGGVKIALGQDATLGLEIMGRKLFTDYLDDVSTRYPDYQTLLRENGLLAATLSNRQGELPGADPVVIPGTVRGNPDFQDWYFFSTVSFAFALDGDGSLFGRNMRTMPCFQF